MLISPDSQAWQRRINWDPILHAIGSSQASTAAAAAVGCHRHCDIGSIQEGMAHPSVPVLGARSVLGLLMGTPWTAFPILPPSLSPTYPPQLPNIPGLPARGQAHCSVRVPSAPYHDETVDQTPFQSHLGSLHPHGVGKTAWSPFSGWLGTIKGCRNS